METVMRLVMCNWTWSLFCPRIFKLDSVAFQLEKAHRHSAHTNCSKAPASLKQWAQVEAHVSVAFPKCPGQLNPSLMSSPPPPPPPKKPTINPHTAFSQVAPPSLWLVCPLELSLYEQDKNTACCEFMAPLELPLKTQPFSDVCSETQVRKQSNHNIYTESPQHRGI